VRMVFEGVDRCPKGHANISPYHHATNTKRYYCSDCQVVYEAPPRADAKPVYLCPSCSNPMQSQDVGYIQVENCHNCKTSYPTSYANINFQIQAPAQQDCSTCGYLHGSRTKGATCGPCSDGTTFQRWKPREAAADAKPGKVKEWEKEAEEQFGGKITEVKKPQTDAPPQPPEDD